LTWAHSIEAFALWNADNSFNDGINGFELLADTDGIFGNGGTTSLGSFNATLPGAPIPAQTFTFGATSTQFVHLNITSNHGASSSVAAGEAAFGASVSNGAGAPYEFSPIPGLVLLGAGIGPTISGSGGRTKITKINKVRVLLLIPGTLILPQDGARQNILFRPPRLRYPSNNYAPIA